MDFSTSEDQEALRELARKILETEATHDRLKQVEAGESRIDRDLWGALAEANLLGVAVPEADGGSGLGLPELGIVLEEIGRTVAPVPALPTLVMGALPLAGFGSDTQRAQWLPDVLGGSRLLTAALTETGSSRTVARHDGSGWRLTGDRPLVPAGMAAHRILVPAHTGEGELGLFWVDPATEGVELEPVEVVSRERWANLALRNARVPDGEVLGDPRGGAAIRDWIVERATLGICALALGVSSRALEMTAKYTSERKQFDRPIGSFQAVHTRAGDAYVDLQCLKLSYWRALHVLQHGGEVGDALAIAKYWAAVASARITYAAQHLHGGIGVDTDYPLHRYYLHATQLGIQLGSASEQLGRMGAELAA